MSCRYCSVARALYTQLSNQLGDANADRELGIVLRLSGDATGTIVLSLSKVQIIGNLGHGVLVNDQDAPTTQDGVPPTPAGSAHP